PLSSALVHTLGAVFFRSDALSPYLNMAWLGLFLLAAYCIGRRRGSGPSCVVAGCALMAVPAFSYSQAASAQSDVASLALLASSIALLVESDGKAWMITVAAAAAGLALGTKFTMVVPVGTLTVAV